MLELESGYIYREKDCLRYHKWLLVLDESDVKNWINLVHILARFTYFNDHTLHFFLSDISVQPLVLFSH